MEGAFEVDNIVTAHTFGDALDVAGNLRETTPNAGTLVPGAPNKIPRKLGTFVSCYLGG